LKGLKNCKTSKRLYNFQRILF